MAGAEGGRRQSRRCAGRGAGGDTGPAADRHLDDLDARAGAPAGRKHPPSSRRPGLRPARRRSRHRHRHARDRRLQRLQPAGRDRRDACPRPDARRSGRGLCGADAGARAHGARACRRRSRRRARGRGRLRAHARCAREGARCLASARHRARRQALVPVRLRRRSRRRQAAADGRDRRAPRRSRRRDERQPAPRVGRLHHVADPRRRGRARRGRRHREPRRRDPSRRRHGGAGRRGAACRQGPRDLSGRGRREVSVLRRGLRRHVAAGPACGWIRAPRGADVHARRRRRRTGRRARRRRRRHRDRPGPQRHPDAGTRRPVRGLARRALRRPCLPGRGEGEGRGRRVGRARPG